MLSATSRASSFIRRLSSRSSNHTTCCTSQSGGAFNQANLNLSIRSWRNPVAKLQRSGLTVSLAVKSYLTCRRQSHPTGACQAKCLIYFRLSLATNLSRVDTLFVPIFRRNGMVCRQAKPPGEGGHATIITKAICDEHHKNELLRLQQDPLGTGVAWLLTQGKPEAKAGYLAVWLA